MSSKRADAATWGLVACAAVFGFLVFTAMGRIVDAWQFLFGGTVLATVAFIAGAGLLYFGASLYRATRAEQEEALQGRFEAAEARLAAIEGSTPEEREAERIRQHNLRVLEQNRERKRREAEAERDGQDPS